MTDFDLNNMLARAGAAVEPEDYVIGQELPGDTQRSSETQPPNANTPAVRVESPEPPLKAEPEPVAEQPKPEPRRKVDPPTLPKRSKSVSSPVREEPPAPTVTPERVNASPEPIPPEPTPTPQAPVERSLRQSKQVSEPPRIMTQPEVRGAQTVSIGLIQQVIGVLDELRRLQSPASVWEILTQKPVEDMTEAKVIEAVLTAPESYKVAISSIVEAKQKDDVDRAFFIMALNPDTLNEIARMLSTSNATISGGSHISLAKAITLKIAELDPILMESYLNTYALIGGASE